MRHGDGMRKHWLGAALLIALISVVPVSADEIEETSSRVLPDWMTLSAGLDVTTQYNFRGIFQEDQGAIVQPWVEAGFSLLDDGESFVKSVDLYVGMWNSYHDGPSTNNQGGDWYEADYYIGASFGLPHNFTADVAFVSLTSPDFSTEIFADEIDVTLAYDDSEWAVWQDVPLTDFSGLAPYVMFAFETDGGSDGVDGGTYMEIGIEPSFTLLESEDYPVTLAVPMTVGLSLDDYYEFGTDDETFGFFDVGLVASMPLPCLGDKFGSWETYVGVHFLFLGNATEAANSKPDDTEIIGSWGISVSY